MDGGPPLLKKGQDLACKVTRVIDGDTLDVEVRRLWSRPRVYRVRLFAIDAPEMSQPMGRESRDFLAQEIAGESCRMRVMDTDRYRRIVAVIYRRRYLKSVNVAMVRAGYAYAYEQYGSLPRLKRAENRARARRLGVWQRSGQTLPWEYRQSRRQGRNKQRGCGTILLLVIVAAIVIVLVRTYGY